MGSSIVWFSHKRIERSVRPVFPGYLSVSYDYVYIIDSKKYNKRNDKRFNNRGYSFLFLMGIFLKHLWLIPNILKWQDCNIFTKLVPLKILSRSSDRRLSIKKGVLKHLRNFTGKHLYWSLFLIYLQTFRPATLLRRDTNTGFFLWNLRNF